MPQTPPQLPQSKVPSIAELKVDIRKVFFLTVSSLTKMGVPAPTLSAVGSVIAKLDFAKQPTEDELDKMFDEAATKALEDLTVLMLRSSITN